MISAHTKFIVIIGDPVNHSLSPSMHNACYKQLGISDRYVYLAARTNVADVGHVVQTMRVMDNFHGLTCTQPHKVEVMSHLDWVESHALAIGAVNTVVKHEGKLKGYNTDWTGVTRSFEKHGIGLSGKRTLVLGAGGASRAVIYGLKSRGGKVTIFNRSVDKAKQLAKEFACDVLTEPTSSAISKFDILFNATPLGMHPYETESPLPQGLIQAHHVVFDAIYAPKETPFVKEALLTGATVIYGWEMLIHQGYTQFEIYTGMKPPLDVMEQILLN